MNLNSALFALFLTTAVATMTSPFANAVSFVPATIVAPTLSSGTYVMSANDVCALNIIQSPDKLSITVTLFTNPDTAATGRQCTYDGQDLGTGNSSAPMSLGSLNLGGMVQCRDNYSCYVGKNVTIYVVNKDLISFGGDPATTSSDLFSRDVPAQACAQQSTALNR